MADKKFSFSFKTTE